MGSRRKPLRPAVMAALTRAGSGARAPGDQASQIVVDDHLEPRVRIPADLLRCAIAGLEIAALVGLALLANATATGVEVDVLGVCNPLPHSLLNLTRFATYHPQL